MSNFRQTRKRLPKIDRLGESSATNGHARDYGFVFSSNVSDWQYNPKVSRSRRHAKRKSQD